MRGKLALALLAGAMALGSLLTGPAWAGEGPTAPPLSLTADEQLVLRMINQERQERDLAALEPDPVLIKVAREHSQDMAERGYFAHLAPPPEPTTPLDRYAAAIGRRPQEVVGENIARAREPVMAMIHESMVASPEHKANILDVDYARVGVGIYVLVDGRVWVTEMFRGASPADAPTSGG